MSDAIAYYLFLPLALSLSSPLPLATMNETHTLTHHRDIFISTRKSNEIIAELAFLCWLGHIPTDRTNVDTVNYPSCCL